MSQLYTLELTVSDEDFPLAQALVFQAAKDGWEEDTLPSGDYIIRFTSDKQEERDHLAQTLSQFIPSAELNIFEEINKDWTVNWKKYFTRVHVGKFSIIPPWETGTTYGAIPIMIEPKSAFGTGHHPTTTMCLEAITRLINNGSLKKGQDFLDLGTGTGILGIGCAKYGLTGIGVDIDPISISNARENCRLNQIDKEFILKEGSINITAGKKFDIVVANILAEPLEEMAEPIMKAIKNGGSLILSGFLSVQIPRMLKAYAQLGIPQRIVQPSLADDPTRELNEGIEKDLWVCFYWDSISKK